MSCWSRIANVFSGRRLALEIDEELDAHIQEAIEHGRHPDEARRAFGSRLSVRERTVDERLATRLDAVRADIVFGFRQLRKNRVSTIAAILSLALAMGACLAVFRLLDAIVFRPLPIADAGRLFVLTYPRMTAAGKIEIADSFDYPQFRKLRTAVERDAEMIAISPPALSDLTFSAGQEVERMRVQFVSGSMFDTFGLKPALGRLLTAGDDKTPGSNAVAVVTWNTWTRRFGRDPDIVGRRFRFGDTSYEIVGVSPEGFTGTEPGWITDLFVPTMMNSKLIDQPNWAWFRSWIHLAPGASPDLVRVRLKAAERADRLERVKNQRWPRERYQQYIASELFLERAAAGVSGLQRQYRWPLAVLAFVVFMVLLIACVNLANLMTARAQTRVREMAVRVSIGAGRARVIQLVLIESSLIGICACGLASLFASWATPFLVRQITPASAPPLALSLSYDWRISAFSALLVLLATLSFGGLPALRASAIAPAAGLRGGTERLHRRSMNVLVGAQVAFCVLVLFVAGLFAASFQRLASQPLGFDPDRLVNLNTTTGPNASLADWEAVRRELLNVPGVASVAISTWPMLFGPVWSEPISVDGKPAISEEAEFLATSPDWLRTMHVPIFSGRELRQDDGIPGPALVNREFARRYFDGRDPVGLSFRTKVAGKALTCAIVGLVGDVRYSDLRQSMRPAVYLPFSVPQPVFAGAGTLVVRTSLDPASLASTLRQRVSQTRPSFRVTEVYTQRSLIDQHTIRERLLAMVGLFFAGVALALSVIGVSGVLMYSVLQRRREIGIRMALGQPPGKLAWSVVSGVLAMLAPGAIAGLAAGIACQRYFRALLYESTSIDPGIIGLTVAVTIIITIISALPAVNRARRVDPAAMLRAD